jgi:hypothetical protein
MKGTTQPTKLDRASRGMNVTVQSLNNKLKKYTHVPRCNYGDTANMAFRKYKVVEQIVDTIGGGVKLPERLDNGALWLGKRFTETNREEFATCSRRAGITAMPKMSPEATSAMRHDALVTKTKQQKIARHLFEWFGGPIPANKNGR